MVHRTYIYIYTHIWFGVKFGKNAAWGTHEWGGDVENEGWWTHQQQVIWSWSPEKNKHPISKYDLDKTTHCQ